MAPIPPVKPGEMHDIKGVPIYPGDLVRTFHFTERRRGGRLRNHYLYHVIIVNQGDLEMVPASELHGPDGGRCWLKILDPAAEQMVVINGYGPETGWSHRDRPRKRMEVPRG